MRWKPRLVTQTLLLQLVLVVLSLTVLSVLFVRRTEHNLRVQYGERALAVAHAVASLPSVHEAFARSEPAADLQPLAEAIRSAADMSFVVIANADGIRYSHPNPALVGQPLSTPPAAVRLGESGIFTETGTLGPSVRGKAPIHDQRGQVIGQVSVGVLTGEIAARASDELPSILGYSGAALALGAVGSWLLARRVRRQTLGLEPSDIRTLVENREATLLGIREGVVVLDGRGRVSLINDEANRLLGGDGSWTGRRFVDVVTSERIRVLVAERAESRDVQVLSGDRVLVVNVMPVAVRGRPIGSVLTLRDRTELETLGRELDTTRGLADGLRAQSHEFSNRLHTVAGLIQLGRTDEALRYIDQESRLHQELADSLTARIGDPTLVALLLAKATRASERGIELQVTSQSTIPGWLRSPADVVTVVGNLIENAFDAVSVSHATSGVVEVDLSSVGDDLVVHVQDTGGGISPDDAERIFDEGFTTKAQPGEAIARGIGLALVSQIARRYGGLAAASDPPPAIAGWYPPPRRLSGARIVVVLPSMVVPNPAAVR